MCGIVFGATSPLFGHPIDSIKTRMQADLRFTSSSALVTFRTIVKSEGFLALYRGLIPPMLSSSVFRSVQFSTYASTVGACRDSESLCTPIPALMDTQPRVLIAGLVSSTARTAIEVPCEYIKIKRQLNEPWRESFFKEAYRGAFLSWARMVVALGGYFLFMDITSRKYAYLFDTPALGTFLQGSICATTAWAAAWPLELLRTTKQAGLYPGLGALERTAAILRDRGGIIGLYRGIGPGLLRSIVANGSATLAYTTCRSCWPT